MVIAILVGVAVAEDLQESVSCHPYTLLSISPGAEAPGLGGSAVCQTALSDGIDSISQAIARFL
jgi:hypothetical protein